MRLIFVLAGLLAFGAAHADEHERTFYIGVDTVDLRVSEFRAVNGPGNSVPDPQRNDADPDMLRVTAGMMLNEDFSVQLQYGIDGGEDDSDPNNVIEVDSFMGGYLAAHTNLTENVRAKFMLGFGQLSLANATTNVSEDEDGISYGLNLNYPLNLLLSKVPVFGDLLGMVPAIDVSAGYMVYQQNDDAVSNGMNLGLNYQFSR